MDRRSARPENLPPLVLRPLRELILVEPSGPGRPAHIAAASGVVRRGVFAYVIGDDELAIGVFDLSNAKPGDLRRALSGDLPADPEERKAQKADLEALTALPPFEGAPHGGLLGLGSGSKPGRDRGFFWPFDADGSLAGEPRPIQLAPLYDVLRSELDAVNVEGASVLGDHLWLFHRGKGADAPNAVAELSLAALTSSLRGDHAIDSAELTGLREYALGDLDGVPLAFSDASSLFGRLVVFTASAEEQGSDADGGIRGSVVGTIDGEGQVRRLREIDRRWKVEGVHAAIDSGVLDLVFVCDQDDPDIPSPLLTATMPLDPRFERG